MQTLKEKNSGTSCSECQRRKQKCSREWPCNHCQARKVPHLCQFGTKKAQQSLSSDDTRDQNEAKGLKRSQSQSEEVPSHLRDVELGEVEDGLKMWGYMPGHLHYNLSRSDKETSLKQFSNKADTPDGVGKILHAIPSRSITDSFVNRFLTVVNYQYCAVYAPTFTDQYVQWWNDRAKGKHLSPEFTCLLLRVLSYSIQYITPSLRRMIEFEMACSSEALSSRFSEAAEQLSKGFSASRMCIERVQEQFLKAAWLKSESRVVEAWHALGCTIREAQELGIDRDTSNDGLTEFDIEIRRRLWVLLFIWDWQMAAWLGRPHLINQRDLQFTFPCLRLDQSSLEPNLLSPFAHMALQAQLSRRITTLLGDAKTTRELTAEQVTAVLAESQRFIDELPPLFRMDDPDLSLDAAHPYFIFQRHQLHVIIYVTMLDFLKPYLSSDPRHPKNSKHEEFRYLGVDLALKLLVVARRLFEHDFFLNAKFHIIVFCVFDTGTLLCAAVINDADQTLPHREQVTDAIESALDMLHQLSVTTKLGASSYKFLYKLVQASPALAHHSAMAICKRQRLGPGCLENHAHLQPAAIASTSTNSGPISDPNLEVFETIQGMVPAPAFPTTDDLFDLDHFLAQSSFGPADQPYVGGMEVIWDWDNLHLNSSEPDPQSVPGDPSAGEDEGASL